MLQLCRSWLGRWSPRDFLRGRTKRGGAIHTRHTHGSRGRYKRLSTIFGLRDGRRHAWNHLNGGLGVKLGGGLFGLRIPRQHALSTMSREEYEIELHGHPNITNPYRQRMDEHPDLKSVMCNACLDLHLVVLMPRVPRTLRPTGALPPPWEKLLQHLVETMQVEDAVLGHGGSITTHCATVSASVTCPHADEGELRSAAGSLFGDHMRGAKVWPTFKESSRRKNGVKHIPFIGTALSTSSLPLARPTVSPSSSTPIPFLERRREESKQHRSQCSEANLVGSDLGQPTQSVSVSQRGAQQLLHDLQLSSPHALSLCLRLGETLCGSDIMLQPGHSEEETRDEVPHRKLLQEEMDPDELGVWKQTAATVDALMRWQYFNWDPRAHCSDGLPHHRRWQPVHIFVDASRVRGESEIHAAEKGGDRHHSVSRSLMSVRFSEKLQEMNFKRVSHRNIPETLEALRRWSVEYHWRAVEKLDCALASRT